MECPACGTEVTLGLHECEECHSDLTHLDEKQKTALQKSILKNTIEMVEPSPPLVLPEESSLLHAIQLLQAHKTGCLMVINSEGQISGILTERDLLFKVAGTSLDLSQTLVKTIMTPSPECLSTHDTIAYALHKMSHGSYRHIPLIDKKSRPTGLLDVKDIMKYIVQMVWPDKA